MMTQRTVAVVLGTECGQVLSLLLHVPSVGLGYPALGAALLLCCHC